MNIEAFPLGSQAGGAPLLRVGFSEESLLLMVGDSENFLP